MAVRSGVWTGARSQVRVVADPAPENVFLTRSQRLARLQRRRRMAQAQAAFEGFAWLAGGGAIVLLAVAGVLGLR